MTADRGKRDSTELLPDGETGMPSRRVGLQLLRKLLIYHVALVIVLGSLAMLFPGFTEQLPIGGVSELVDDADITVESANGAPSPDNEIVGTLMEVTSALDRLGYARRLIIAVIGVWLLMLPVSWVHKGIQRRSASDHSIDETALVLPGVVTAIVLIVQHSLALAFSLAGIIAGVHFRRALQDTFDALFILVAIGSGIAAGVEAIEIAAVLTVFFSYAALYVYFFGEGLEADYVAQRKREKKARKTRADEAHAEDTD